MGPPIIRVIISAMWNTIWHPSQTANWEDLGGNISAHTSPAAVSCSPDRVDIFVVGLKGDVYHKAMEIRWESGAELTDDVGGYHTYWYPSRTGWEPLGGKCRGTPAAVSWGPNKIALFAVGSTSEPRGVSCKIWDPSYSSRWSGWMSLNGKVGDSKIAGTDLP